MGREESLIFKFAPMFFFGINLIFNTCVTRQYLQAIKRPLSEKEEQEELIYQQWRGKLCSCSRISWLLRSIVLSIHNTGWLNICGQLPLTLKRRLFMHGFTVDYTRATKLSNILPRSLIFLYGVYFGVFEAFGNLKTYETKMAILDTSVISCLHSFLLLLALNF